MSIENAFHNFMSQDFEDTVISSTKASWSGGSYKVELFCDGSYRIHWSGNVGNLYDSNGLMLTVPSLSDEDWNQTPSQCFFDNAEEEMRAKFRESLASIL